MRSTSGSSRRGLDDPGLSLRPVRAVDRKAVLGHHVDRRHVLPLLARQGVVGHRRQPDVGVEADLMRGVAGQHRAAAGLGDVADENAVPDAFGLGLAGEPLEEGDHRRIAPHAVAREPHHLPGLAVHGQHPGAGETASPVIADRAGLGLDRRHRAAEHLFGRKFWIGRIGERRKGLGVERPLVLRQGPRSVGRRRERQDKADPSHTHPFAQSRLHACGQFETKRVNRPLTNPPLPRPRVVFVAGAIFINS